MYVVDNEEGLQSLGNDIMNIRRLYPDDHDRQSDFRLIGMFYHLFTPARVRNTGRLTCALETHLLVVKESLQESFLFRVGGSNKCSKLREMIRLIAGSGCGAGAWGATIPAIGGTPLAKIRRAEAAGRKAPAIVLVPARIPSPQLTEASSARGPHTLPQV